MKVLIDTNVVSELYKSPPSSVVLDKLERMAQHTFYVSVVTFGEIQYGISRLSAGAKKRSLRNWLNSVEASYAGRILPIDLEISRIWGEISASSESQDRPMQTEDAFIAATAVHHGMHLMTRNTKGFANTGVLLINPWED